MSYLTKEPTAKPIDSIIKAGTKLRRYSCSYGNCIGEVFSVKDNIALVTIVGEDGEIQAFECYNHELLLDSDFVIVREEELDEKDMPLLAKLKRALPDVWPEYFEETIDIEHH